jgi:predicted O-linked N-acetylglucosamine transferase (SPINDLY family)
VSGLAPELIGAVDLLNANRAQEALDAVTRYRERTPSDPAALQVLAQTLLRLGRDADSLAALRELCALAPRHPDAHIALAQACLAQGLSDESAAAARRACEVAPGYAPAWGTLSAALLATQDSRGSADAGKRAVSLAPTAPEGYQNLAAALIALGRPEEATNVLARGHQNAPHVPAILDSLLIALNASDVPKDQVLEGHRRYGQAATGPISDWRLLAAHTNPDPDRPLRVGVLSSDLRTHAVAFFLRAALEHLPSDGSEWIALSSGRTEDATSETLRSSFTQWLGVAGLDNRALDAAIRRERIDVLLELNGHSVGNRLQSLACGPAPVIITAIGYPNTTGVPAIGYRFVDSRTDPPGEDAFATERLIRLDPCFLCYSPPSDAPQVSQLPCSMEEGAPVTFGSFNASQKLTMRTLRLWARVLNEVPHARLILKSMNYGNAQAREEAARRFEAAGGDATRLTCLPPSASIADHLACYSRVDLALDPTPYAGTTTTCEALWMGAPVVTLAGSTHAGRVGVSLLGAAEMPEWIAASDEEYVQIAVRAASDRKALESVRAGLRERVSRSPLCDARAYAKRFHGAIRSCWREWCATQATH